MKQLHGQALIILGAPRSGTSAVANAFRLLGFYLGEDADFPAPKAGNPMGIFERGEILGFGAKCSDELYLRHDRPDLESMSEHPKFARLVDEASAILRGSFSGHDRWGWKEPQTTLLAPIYQAALARDDVVPSYLICVRRPTEVIESQYKIMETAETNREAPLGVKAYRRWLAYTLKSFEFSKGSRRAVVAYHELVAEPRAILEGAFRAVTGGDEPGRAALDEACRSIKPDLHRNRVKRDVPVDAPETVHKLWELCCEATLDPAGLLEGAYDEQVAEVKADYERLSTCFGEPAPPHCAVMFYLPGGKAVFGSPVLPTGRWNEVEIRISTPAATELLGMLYPLPANVYVRNARWDGGAAKIRPAVDTIESKEGDATLFAVGPARPQVTLRTPTDVGPYRLRMEVFVEMNFFIALDTLSAQVKKTRQLEGQLDALSKHAGRLEEETMRLRQELSRAKVSG